MRSPRKSDPHVAAILTVVLSIAAGCNSPERRLERGDRFRDRGETDLAVEQYRAAGASTDPEVGGVALLRAAEILRASNSDEAETSCEEAVARFPASEPAATCLLLIADLRRDRLDWWGAIDAYRELLSQRADDPGCADIRHEIARCYVELGDPGQALVEWTELLERYPDGPRAASALLGVARCHDLAGDAGLALTVYQRVRERFPDGAEAVEALVGEAGCMEMLGDLDGAEDLYRQALESHPNRAMVQRRLELLQQSRSIRLPPSP